VYWNLLPVIEMMRRFPTVQLLWHVIEITRKVSITLYCAKLVFDKHNDFDSMLRTVKLRLWMITLMAFCKRRQDSSNETIPVNVNS